MLDTHFLEQKRYRKSRTKASAITHRTELLFPIPLLRLLSACMGALHPMVHYRGHHYPGYHFRSSLCHIQDACHQFCGSDRYAQ